MISIKIDQKKPTAKRSPDIKAKVGYARLSRANKEQPV